MRDAAAFCSLSSAGVEDAAAAGVALLLAPSTVSLRLRDVRGDGGAAVAAAVAAFLAGFLRGSSGGITTISSTAAEGEAQLEASDGAAAATPAQLATSATAPVGSDMAEADE